MGADSELTPSLNAEEDTGLCQNRQQFRVLVVRSAYFEELSWKGIQYDHEPETRI